MILRKCKNIRIDWGVRLKNCYHKLFQAVDSQGINLVLVGVDWVLTDMGEGKKQRMID